MEGFTSLFADSSSSGKLANFSITDFGSQLKKAKVSFGNVNLGIYRQGPRQKPTLIFHDRASEKELYNLIANLKYKGHYYASYRNFQGGTITNFTPVDFAHGLYFSTWTFNNFKKDLKFYFSFETARGKKCVFPNCQQSHCYQTVPVEVSSFLAEKKTAKKKLGRELEGVNDLFARALRLIHEYWKPTNFKYVAVPELHKCQTPCHWRQKKQKKTSWKSHDEKLCHCPTKHDCLRNWHVHMLSTDFLPERYKHNKCGLGTYNNQGDPRGCWDHRAYIAHDIWPYGLVDMKRVNHLKVQKKPIHSAEGVILYLVKYLAKAFQMRQNKELAEKVGLLPGMGIYKFFRVIYGYSEDSKPYIVAKRKKPVTSSRVFINNDYGYSQEAERDFSNYFDKDLRLKKNAKQILQAREKFVPPSPKTEWKLTDLLKLCLRFSSKSKVKKNHFWKPCDTSEDPIWKPGQGWKVKCPIRPDHHLEPIVRWEFHFNGTGAYQAYQTYILPALNSLKLPNFTKYQHYQPSDQDYLKFAHEAKMPWNKPINEYEPLAEIDERADSQKWRDTIPPELIYNHVYLKEIRSQISCSSNSWGLSAEAAAKRYADY